MHFKPLLIVLCCFLFSCYDKYSRKSHNSTTALQQGLFVETYTVFGAGASGTDMVSQYLTDSLHFRQYVGTFDQGPEFYYYRISGDTIFVEQCQSGMYTGKKILLQRTQLFISALRQSNNIQ